MKTLFFTLSWGTLFSLLCVQLAAQNFDNTYNSSAAGFNNADGSSGFVTWGLRYVANSFDKEYTKLQTTSAGVQTGTSTVTIANPENALIFLTRDEGFLKTSATTPNTVVLRKYNSNGTLVWTQNYIVTGFTHIYSPKAVQAIDGSIFLFGYGGIGDVNAAPIAKTYIIKAQENGTFIYVNSNFIAGTNGSTQTIPAIGIASLTASPNGGIVASATPYLSGIAVMRFNNTGAILSNYLASTNTNNLPINAIDDAAGNTYIGLNVSGTFGTSQISIRKYTSTGTLLFDSGGVPFSNNLFSNCTAPLLTNVSLNVMNPTQDGGIVFGGIYTPCGTSNNYQYIAKLKPDGTLGVVIKDIFYNTYTVINYLRELSDGSIVATGLKNGQLWLARYNSTTTPPPGNNIDLQLTAATPSPANPAIYTNYSTTYTLRNNSTTNATNVVVSTKIIGQGVYNGGNPGTASIGSFAINAGADATWTVGSLAAGATATLTVNIFTLTASSINTLVQVKSASQTDADSSPNNRTSCPAVEDDEVCSASNSTTPPVQQPDLRITYPSLSGTNYTLGYIFTSNFNVSNIGTGASSGSFLVKYYISSDNTWSSNDIQVGQTTVANSIAAGQSTSGSCSIALPSAPFSTGTYYLFAVVDVPSSITESDENNNTYSQAITITNDTSNLPDLQITNLIAPSTVNISAYYILSYSISNLTNYPTGGSFPIRFVLSTDNTYSANDLLVAEVGAAVGQNSSVIRNNDFIAIPYGTPVGNYYLIGYIDSQNVVSESNENNNTVSQAITVQGPTVLQQIDLIPTTLRTEHYSIYNTNTYYPVQYTVALNGTFSALPGDFVVTYYLSTDNSLSSNDLLVGQHTTNHAFLYTGQVAVGNLNLTLPTTVTSGNYYLFIKVDGSNIIAETNENNNLISGAITVQGTTSTNLPDLTITSLTSAASGAQGNITNYTFNLNNVGTLTASGSYVIGAYLSTDNTLSTNDIQVGVVNTGNTPVGTISNVPGSITVPVTLAPGTYYLILKADINNVITESSETNNTTNAVLYTVTAVGGGNGGGSCQVNFSNGNIICTEQNGTNLDITFDTSGVRNKKTINPVTGQTLSSQQLSIPVSYYFQFSKENDILYLRKYNSNGGALIEQKTVPNTLANQYYSFNNAVQTSTGYILFAFKGLNTTTNFYDSLYAIKTDINLNIQVSKFIASGGFINGSGVNSVLYYPLSGQTIFTYFSGSTNGSANQLIDMFVLDSNIAIKSKRTLYTTGQYFSVAPYFYLSPCNNFITLKTQITTSFCVHGACLIYKEETGRIVADTFQVVRSYSYSENSVYGFGTHTKNWFWTGANNVVITASNTQILPISSTNPFNDSINIVKKQNGVTIWTKSVVVPNATWVREIWEINNNLIFIGNTAYPNYILFTTSESCLNNGGGSTTNGVDMQLTAAKTGNNGAWQTVTVTFTAKNNGTVATNNVAAGITIPTSGIVFQGGNEYTASQGSFAPYGNKVWTIGTLNPGQQATLTLRLFTKVATALPVYGQVTAHSGIDVDSQPNNGTCCTAAQDDEAVAILNSTAAAETEYNIDFLAKSVQLYPNPSSDFFFLDLTAYSERTVKINIVNQLGVLIRETSLLIDSGFTTKEMDISDLPDGLFMLVIQSDNLPTISKRFVKHKE